MATVPIPFDLWHTGFSPTLAAVNGPDTSINLNAAGMAVLNSAPQTTGKWIFEFRLWGNSATNARVGLWDTASSPIPASTSDPTNTANCVGIDIASGDVYVDGAVQNTVTGVTALGASDIYMMYVNLDTGNVWFGKSNTWFDGSDPFTESNPHAIGVTSIGATSFSPCLWLNAASEIRTYTSYTHSIYDCPHDAIPWGYHQHAGRWDLYRAGETPGSTNDYGRYLGNPVYREAYASSRYTRAIADRGKYYFEINLGYHSTSADIRLGFIGTGRNFGSNEILLGSQIHEWALRMPLGWVYYNGVGVDRVGWINPQEPNSGQCFGFAVDMNSGKVWMSRDGLWAYGIDPTDNTEYHQIDNLISSGATDIMPAIQSDDTSSGYELRLLSDLFEYPIPDGYNAWADDQTPPTLLAAADLTVTTGTSSPTLTPGVAPAMTLTVDGDGQNIIGNGRQCVTTNAWNGFGAMLDQALSLSGNSDKRYMEWEIVKVSTGSINVYWGISDPSSASLYQQPGTSYGSFAPWLEDGDVWHDYANTDCSSNYLFPGFNYHDAFSDGDIVQLAVDLTTGELWFGINNYWGNNGNPSAGTGEACSGIFTFFDTSNTCKPHFMIYGGDTTGDGVIVRAMESELNYAMPTGFNAWDPWVAPASAILAPASLEVPAPVIESPTLTTGPGWDGILWDPSLTSTFFDISGLNNKRVTANQNNPSSFCAVVGIDKPRLTRSRFVVLFNKHLTLSPVSTAIGVVNHIDDGGTFDETIRGYEDPGFWGFRGGDEFWANGVSNSPNYLGNEFPNDADFSVEVFVDTVAGNIWFYCNGQFWGELDAASSPFDGTNPSISDPNLIGKNIRPASSTYYTGQYCEIFLSFYEGLGTSYDDAVNFLPWVEYVPPAPATDGFAWDVLPHIPANDGTLIVTDSGRTIENTSDSLGYFKAATSARFPTTGKVYWEYTWAYIQQHEVGGNRYRPFYFYFSPGVEKGDRDPTNTKYIQYYPNSIGWNMTGGVWRYDNTEISTNLDGYLDIDPPFADGQTIMFALDIDTGDLWLGHEGVWQYSGDPAGGGLGKIDTEMNIRPYSSDMVLCMVIDETSKVTLNARDSELVYTKPAGFTALDQTPPIVRLNLDSIESQAEISSPQLNSPPYVIDASRANLSFYELAGLHLDLAYHPNQNPPAGDHYCVTVESKDAFTKGKRYFEWHWLDATRQPRLDNVGLNRYIGIADSTFDTFSLYPGENQFSWAFNTTGSLITDGVSDPFTYTPVLEPTSYVIGCSVDLDAGKVWFHHNGNVIGAIGAAGTPNPTTGDYPAFINPNIVNRAIYPLIEPIGWDNYSRLVLDQGEMVLPVPEGYEVWRAPERTTMKVRNITVQARISRPTLVYDPPMEIEGNLVIDTIQCGYRIDNIWGELQIPSLSMNGSANVNQAAIGTLPIGGIRLQGQVSMSAAVQGTLPITRIQLHSTALIMAACQGTLAIGGIKLQARVDQFEPLTGEFQIGGIKLSGRVAVGTGQELTYTLTNKRRGDNWEQSQ